MNENNSFEIIKLFLSQEMTEFTCNPTKDVISVGKPTHYTVVFKKDQEKERYKSSVLKFKVIVNRTPISNEENPELAALGIDKISLKSIEEISTCTFMSGRMGSFPIGVYTANSTQIKLTPNYKLLHDTLEPFLINALTPKPVNPFVLKMNLLVYPEEVTS